MTDIRTVEVNGVRAKVLVTGALQYVKKVDPLTPAGAGFATGDNNYLEAFGSKRYKTPAWQRFKRALRSRDPQKIVDAAKPLRSVKVALDKTYLLNPNYGLRISHSFWRFYCAPLVEVSDG